MRITKAEVCDQFAYVTTDNGKFHRNFGGEWFWDSGEPVSREFAAKLDGSLDEYLRAVAARRGPKSERLTPDKIASLADLAREHSPGNEP